MIIPDSDYWEVSFLSRSNQGSILVLTESNDRFGVAKEEPLLVGRDIHCDEVSSRSEGDVLF